MKTIPTVLVVLSLAATGLAQTKLSGKAHCGKADEEHTLEIGDRPNHAFQLARITCSWTTPFEIEGVKAKDDVLTGYSEIRGDKLRDRGYSVVGMENGDKMTAEYQGSEAATKDGKVAGGGAWNITSATGKFKGIKEKGAYKCSGDANGYDCEIEGEYTLPAK